MGGILLDFGAIIDKSLNELCEELLSLKRSYFTAKGKSGWNPLKASTLRTKKYKTPFDVNAFNKVTGKLQDSIEVTWEYTDTGVEIIVESSDSVQLLKYLTETLGRDFITIDDNEKSFIINRFTRFIKQNVSNF